MTATSRVRFNWGYHDGASSARRGHEAAPNGLSGQGTDEVYAQGVLAGFADQTKGVYAEDSTQAWEEAIAWGDVKA